MSLSTLFPVGCYRVYSPGAALDFLDDIGPSFSISSSSSSVVVLAAVEVVLKVFN